MADREELSLDMTIIEGFEMLARQGHAIGCMRVEFDLPNAVPMLVVMAFGPAADAVENAVDELGKAVAQTPGGAVISYSTDGEGNIISLSPEGS